MSEKSILQMNTPKAGTEWTPELEQPSLKRKTLKPEFKESLEFTIKEIRENTKNHYRDKNIEKAGNALIEDPFAYYIPSPSSNPGIYLRIKEMITDFQAFIHQYTSYFLQEIPELFRSHLRTLTREVLQAFRGIWDIYVMHVYWHMLAHHVLEDIQTIKNGLELEEEPLTRKTEERFCEYYAFTTEDQRVYPKIPQYSFIRWILLAPGSFAGKQIHEEGIRKSILACLYYYWQRNLSKMFPPKIEETIISRVNGLWQGLWNAHKKGVTIITFPSSQPTEIYQNIYVTSL